MIAKFVLYLAHIRANKWVQIVAGTIVVGAGLVFFLSRVGSSYDQLRRNWQAVNWIYLGIALICMLACFVLQAVAWYFVVRALNGRIQFLTAIRLYGLTLLPRYIPGSIWGYAGRTVLLEKYGVTSGISVKSTVIEIVYLVSIGAVVAAYKASALVGLVVPRATLGALLGVAIVAAAGNVFTRSGQFSKLGSWFGIGVIYVIFWILYGAATWLTTVAIAPVSCLSCGVDVISSQALAWLGGFLVFFVPGGLGVRDGLLTILLTPGIGAVGALFVSIMTRLLNLLAEACFSVSCIMLRNKPIPSK